MNFIMRKIIAMTCLLLFCVGASAQRRTIDHPPVDFRNSGIQRIVRIEADKESTRVHMLNEFIPGWWVNFPPETFLEDEATGRRYFITGMEGGKIDERITTPPSGDTLVVLIFPPLEKEVKKVHFGELDEVMLYGVALEKPRGRQVSRESGELPAEIRDWMAGEIGEYGEVQAKRFDAPDFFGHGTARIVGYIRGYDPRAGFETGIVYQDNNLTDESFPISFQIEPDGRFIVDVPLVHPEKINLMINRSIIPMYVEQGTKTGVILDWEDFLLIDRFRDGSREFEKTEYTGALGRLNRELVAFAPVQISYQERQREENERTPLQVKDFYRGILDANLAVLEESKGRYSEDTYRLLKAAEYYAWGERLMDYEMDSRYEGDPLPSEFYGFLKEFPLDDPGLMTTGECVFLNRFEHMKPLRDGWMSAIRSMNPPSFEEFLEQEMGLELSEEDRESQILLDSLSAGLNRTGQRDSVLIESITRASAALRDKYKEEFDLYAQRHVYTPKSRSEELQDRLRGQDSVYSQVLGLSPSLTYDITKVRLLKAQMKDADRSEALKISRVVSDAVSHPFLKDEVWRIFEESLPTEGGPAGYALPPGRAADHFKSIVDRFRGNLVLVDFWATTCGPCVSNIRATREQRKQFAAEGRLTYVFITSENESPQAAYDEFVEEQELHNTFRVTPDEWNRFRELFKFSGIPHYVLLDKEGRVLDDDFRSHFLESELKKYE